MDPTQTRIELLEGLLKELANAAERLLLASNGLSDNEWKTPDGTFTHRWPVGGYESRLAELDKAHDKAHAYFNPKEAEAAEKWRNACATASYIVDRYRESRKEGLEHPNLIESSLHRNIADAVFGTLVQTAEDRAAGKEPSTMKDRLNRLVEEGKLFPLDPEN